MFKRLLTIIFVLAFRALLPAYAVEGNVKFAWMSDLHYQEGNRSIASIMECIHEINALKGSEDAPDFVLATGDLTDFGLDSQLEGVKVLLDSLNIPYYVLSGNHDSKWSESGCNTFLKVFGYENFILERGGYRFVACASGPDMRMCPALVPRQHIEWLREVRQKSEPMPTIFVNHYPMDSMVLNYGAVRSELRKMDVRVALAGHLHTNKPYRCGDMQTIIGRSTLPSKGLSGYNLVTIKGKKLSVQSRFPMAPSKNKIWFEYILDPIAGEEPLDKDKLPADYPWTRYDVNEKYNQVKELWRFQEANNIGSGFAYDGKGKAFYATATGIVRCFNPFSGERLWSRELPGKVYSTPACLGNRLVLGCADGNIYCLSAKDGREIWKVCTAKSVLGSPAIYDGKAYIGGSDGHFRCIDMKSGKVVWDFSGIGGFVECRPWVDKDYVLFGAWDRHFYCLSTKTGQLLHTLVLKEGSLMYSPAACNPVRVGDRAYVACPDRKLYVVDLKKGEIEASVAGGREAIGLSSDGKYVFSKVMSGTVYAVPASGEVYKVWECETPLGYEISPTEMLDVEGVLFVPSDKGNVIGIRISDGSFLWEHKIACGLVNPMKVIKTPEGGKLVLASTMDGAVCALSCSSPEP